MAKRRKRLFTRRRLLRFGVVTVIALVLIWFLGRAAIARWAIDTTLNAINLQPASYSIDSVGFTSLRMKNLAVGSEPWLTADEVIVDYTIFDLLALRVSTINIYRGRWKVVNTNGEIDWGYALPPSDEDDEPLTLEMPLERIMLHDSAIEYISDKGVEMFPITLAVANGEGETLAGEFQLSAYEWGAEFDFSVANSLERIELQLLGRAGMTDWSEEARPKVEAKLTRETAGRVSLVMSAIAEDFTATVNKTNISAERAKWSISAAMTPDRAIESVWATLSVTNGVVNGQPINWLAISAETPDDEEVFPLENIPLLLDFSATGDNWNLPAAGGRAAFSKTDDALSLTLGMSTTLPVSIDYDAASVAGTFPSLAAGMTITRDNSGISVSNGKLSAAGGTLRAGDLNIANIRALAMIHSMDEVAVDTFTAVVGDGAMISASPFTFERANPRIATRINFDNLSLEQWLPIMTSDNATGEGRVDGYTDVSIARVNGSWIVEDVRGFLSADPEHGFIQVTEAEALGELLDEQDPRFKTDEVMKPVRDKIVAALRDFSFNKLSVDFNRQGDVTSALAYLSGHGRHGEDPQGINLTLDMSVEDAFVNAYLRLAKQFEIKSNAQEALDRFFDEANNSTGSQETEQ